ncbi:MAG: MATE family efflux transporter [Lachnospiraceae bacterium]|nr:MATE family efflux transporter [Lachnospiraceae bacterium]
MNNNRQSAAYGNPLGTLPVRQLMKKFAMPSIVAMLVSAVYNIVDQLFIGQAVGTHGNAATNIAFPLAMLCTSIALMFGIGGASSFNLKLGAGEEEQAPYYVGNAIFGLVFCGTILALVVELFLQPLLIGFGSPSEVLPYATDYVRITAIGFPFLILTIGGGHLIRADGSPKMTMLCNLSGAVINVFLDALFVMAFGWGMAGAALATILGQFFSAGLAINYLMHYKTVALGRKHMKPREEYLGFIMKIGAASSINQLAMMVVQILLNNSLKYYGARSIYGESIPIACAGIVSKCNQLFFSVVIGLSQGSQPIESFNYGAKRYDRVREAYFMAIKAGALISVIAFLLFQIFPRQLIGLFGEGTEEYYRFAVSYFRVYLFFTFANFVQPISSTFFTSIGKPAKGMFTSLTRQIIFLVPLILLLPMVMGIDGILYAGPIADCLAAVVTTVLVVLEFRNMRKLEAAKNSSS